jgi:hypothetical protein
MTWLQKYVNNFYRCIPCHIKDMKKYSLNLTLECDELRSFVKSKENPVYVWLAFDRNTRKILAVYLGDRSQKSAEELFRPHNTVPVEKVVAKQIRAKDLIILGDKDALAWSGKLYLSPKNFLIMKGQFGILFIITTRF